MLIQFDLRFDHTCGFKRRCGNLNTFLSLPQFNPNNARLFKGTSNLL